jgi:hypothetical protein
MDICTGAHLLDSGRMDNNQFNLRADLWCLAGTHGAKSLLPTWPEWSDQSIARMDGCAGSHLLDSRCMDNDQLNMHADLWSVASTCNAKFDLPNGTEWRDCSNTRMDCCTIADLLDRRALDNDE